VARDLPKFSFDTQESVPFVGKYLKPGDLVKSPNAMMPLFDAIHTRRTARQYAFEMVDEETFRWLVAACMNAPTACNEQQWKLILIDDPVLIQELYERDSASFIGKARQCFLLCYNGRSDNREWNDHIQSGAAFVTTFQLLAHSIGIGSCWIGHLPNRSEVRRLFGIDRAYDPVALVSFGYYRSKVKTMPRKHDASRIIMKNRFSREGLAYEPTGKILFRTFARYVYYKLPAIIRKRLRPYVVKYEKKFYYEVYD